MSKRIQRDRDSQNSPEITKDEFFAAERSPSVKPQPLSDIPSVQKQNLPTAPTKSSYSAKHLLAERVLPEPSTFTLQAKLEIGAAGDRYEQEADRVANQVVQRLHSPELEPSQKPPILQTGKERQYKVQMRPQPIDTLQRKDYLNGGKASKELEAGINRARGGGQPLDARLQKSMGQTMGVDFSGVRVHTNASADTLNRSIQAKAFTTGQDVFFKQGEYHPGSQEGQKLIAHELTHVVQQRGSGSSNYIHRMPDDADETTNQGNYSVKRSNRDWLYGTLDAAGPKPTKLYETKKFEGKDDEPDYMGWRANVAFIDEMKKARLALESYTMSEDTELDDEDEEKLLQNQERFKSASIALTEVVTQISQDENSIGLIADNDCGGFAFALRNLIYEELFTEDPSIIDTTTQQKTWFGREQDSVGASDMQMEIGDTMSHIFDPNTKLKTIRCGGHHSTVVAKDGSEVISLEAHAGKKELNRPSFHIRGGVSDFVQESQVNSKGKQTNVGTEGYVTKGIDPTDLKRRMTDMYKNNRERFLRFLEENQKDVAVRTKVIGLDKESLGDLVSKPQDWTINPEDIQSREP